MVSQMDIIEIMDQEWANLKKQPSHYERYKQRLLVNFPLDQYENNLIMPYTPLDEAEETEYLNCVNLFKGKKWLEVSLDPLYKNYSDFLFLTETGIKYYLPTFLLYFYDLKRLKHRYFDCFMDILELGLKRKPKTDFSGFEYLTTEQAKLIAVFLVNVANLLSDDNPEKNRAQNALINYWGNFLLF